MRDTLNDVLKHTHSLGFFEQIKITSADDKATVDAMDNDRTILLNGVLKNPLPDLQGTFGVQRLQLLQGFLNFANYKAEKSFVTVRTRTDGETIAPEDITFHSENDAQTSTFRFLSADLLPTMGIYTGRDWDVEVNPERGRVLEFMTLANIMASYESWFHIVVDNQNRLVFRIGEEGSATDYCSIIIAEDVSGTLKGELFWDAKQVIQMMKLGIEENLQLKVSNRGAIRLSMESPFGRYAYTLPARKR